MLTKIVSICILVTFAIGCATHPNKIKATYVSPLQYKDCSCEQLQEELNRLNRKISIVSAQQRREAIKDAIGLSIGLFLFWPALFLMIGHDRGAELAGLKGEYEALENMAKQKECNIVIEKQKKEKKPKKRWTYRGVRRNGIL